MSVIEIDRTAPVVAEAGISIAAPLETVWSILVDLESWPRWNRSVTRMRLNGPLQVGTTFDWTGGGSKIASRIEEVDAPLRIVWSGRTLGIRALHVWTFAAEGTGTRVVTVESFAGGLVRLFPGLFRKLLDKALREGLEALKVEAEIRAAGPRAQESVGLGSSM